MRFAREEGGRFCQEAELMRLEMECSGERSELSLQMRRVE